MSIADIERVRPDRLRCRQLRVLAVVTNESDCRDATQVLLERAYRRWSGRPDCDHFPPVQRWRAVEPGYLDGAELLPGSLIGAAAAGHRPRIRDLSLGVQAALVLHSGCPALVEERVLPRAGHGALAQGSRRGLLVCVYGLPEDDMTLAESVLAGYAGLGALAVVERFSRWLPDNASRPPVSVPARAAGTDPRAVA
ncbi:hypothetical protein IRT45_02775 [Nocardia sp. BSTN01]|uniref:hypothetical protein n=1 Tax=Nocardia sp. BSTN01 TaxID=2783665 RepID=UPI001890A41F|nr:hypothetical protein [Nocardia sp. BSTN01]MBF4996077.1 hypothetical protein [Nocardia sp. BSTN01]